MTRQDEIRMIYDSASSTNTIRKGDNIYVAHDEETYINQSTASKAIKINPFAVTIFDGTITLSPSSDEWRDIERLPDQAVAGGTVFSRIPNYYHNDHVDNWCGNTGDVALERIITDDSILTLIEDRVIQTTLINFMRARKIFFKADGLRPNTRVFPFLDGKNISAFTNGLGGHTGFQFYSETDSDFGNTLKNIAGHPNGASTLITDADGRISGSVIIPNSDTIKIRTGTKEFKILDISVDNEVDAGSTASTPYTSSGFLDTRQAEYVSTRVVLTQGEFRYVEGSGDGGSPGKGTIISDQTHRGGGRFSNIPEYANPIEHEDFAIVNYKDAYSPKGGQFSKVTQTGLYDGFYTARQFEVHKREQAKNYMRQRQTFTLVDDPNGEPSNGAGPQHDNTTDPGGGFGNGSWT